MGFLKLVGKMGGSTLSDGISSELVMLCAWSPTCCRQPPSGQDQGWQEPQPEFDAQQTPWPSLAEAVDKPVQRLGSDGRQTYLHQLPVRRSGWFDRPRGQAVWQDETSSLRSLLEKQRVWKKSLEHFKNRRHSIQQDELNLFICSDPVDAT